MQPSLFHGSCNTHVQYLLTCMDYEALREDHQDRCRLCGQARQHMNVDHDHQRGPAAVRGLLCARCNAAHMRRVDTGEYAIDEATQHYLMTPWYLAIKGKQLGYNPRVSIAVTDLSGRDRTELGRLSAQLFSPYSISKARPSFQNDALASCLANADLRPVLRLIFFLRRGLIKHDIRLREPNQRNFPHFNKGVPA